NPLEVTVNENLTIVTHFALNDLVPEIENNMGVTLFPNPSNGKVVASFAQNFDNVLINLININGQVVSSREIKEITNGSQIEFDLESLSDGLYYLQVTSGNKTSVYKISLQK
ncbi:MAG: T9SS type A sorting domain-containing protein, partial [Bacteroidales bacterium]|nr:T9SS type A sorting domain-containing protein [Bacteroidales bacterium]